MPRPRCFANCSLYAFTGGHRAVRGLRTRGCRFHVRPWTDARHHKRKAAFCFWEGEGGRVSRPPLAPCAFDERLERSTAAMCKPGQWPQRRKNLRGSRSRHMPPSEGERLLSPTMTAFKRPVVPLRCSWFIHKWTISGPSWAGQFSKFPFLEQFSHDPFHRSLDPLSSHKRTGNLLGESRSYSSIILDSREKCVTSVTPKKHPRNQMSA